MLVLHPSSQCDVCLEGYYGSREPVSIPCGHTFCYRCLKAFPKPACPLCRSRFEPDNVQRVHVDKTQLPPATPSLSFADIDAARRFQAQSTRLVLHGGSTDEYRELIGELGSWLETQYPQEHGELRATFVLLWKYGEIQKKLESRKRRVATAEQECSDKIADVEQSCSDRIAAVEQTCADLQKQIDDEREKLNAQLEEERELSAAKYEELEQKSFEEREVLLATERELEQEKERLTKECEDWRTKCDQVSGECRRLTDELSKVNRHDSPRADESVYSYPYDRTAETVTAHRDHVADRDVVKNKDKDNFFLFSPVPHSQPVPDLPSHMSHFNPLADDPDDSSDEALEKSSFIAVSSASRSIPIKHRSDLHRDRARSNASLLSRPDPDAMSISVPKSTLDVHMAGSSVSPNGPAFQYGSRPKDFVPSSLDRLPENALGLRADVTRLPLAEMDPHFRVRQLAQLHDVLSDPASSAPAKSPRKPSVSDGSERERARAAIPSAMSSTRTPSPASSTSQSYSSSHMDKEYNSAPYKPNPNVISCASHAAAERERARASSVNSQNAPSASPAPSSVPPHYPAVSVSSTTSLSHITVTRDQPLQALYAPQSQSQAAPRPGQSRRQSNDSYALSGSLSKGRASALGAVPPQRYPSNLTRAMQGIPS